MFLAKQSGVGEAVVVRFAEDDVVEHPDAENSQTAVLDHLFDY
jgi:hypothetical protein